MLNVIPPQKAGAIAEQAGVTNASGWVPIDPHTFESEQVKDIYVVGDATIASPMPKSGFSANTQAKLAAASIINALSGKPTPQAHTEQYLLQFDRPRLWHFRGAFYMPLPTTNWLKHPAGSAPREASAAFRKQEAQYGEALVCRH